MPLGLGRVASAWRQNGGTVFTIGPTQDILLTPSSLSLATVGATATLVPLAVDGNGSLTGQRVYLYSTDPAHVTVDPDTYVATRVAMGGSALIQGKLVAPVVVTSDEPFFTGAPNQREVISTDYSEYAGVSVAMSQATPQADGSPRLWLASGEPYSQFIADGAGTTAMQIHSLDQSGVETGGYISGSVFTAPANNDNKLVPSTRATHVLELHAQIDTQSAPLTQPFRTKWVLGIIAGLSSVHMQPNFTNLGPPGSPHLTHVGFHGESFSNPLYAGCQPIGPWLEDLINTGQTHRFKHAFRSHSPDPGTVDLLLQSGTVFLTDPALASSLHDGDLITIGSSPAEFAVSSISPTTWGNDSFNNPIPRTSVYVVRQSSISGSAVATNSVQSYNSTVMHAHFSQSRASSTVINGNPLAINELQTSLMVSAFDGDRTCVVTRTNPDVYDLAQDYLGLPYSSILDGFFRVWINGIKIMDISRDALGVVPAGGEQAYTLSLIDTGMLSVDATILEWRLGGPQTYGSGYTITYRHRYRWYVQDET